MATITPNENGPIGSARVVNWETMATGDTATAVTLQNLEGAVACVQISGTFGGATVTFQASNDNTNWVTLKDISGTSVSVTAAGLVELSTSAVYVRPAISGGTSDDVDVVAVFRG